MRKIADEKQAQRIKKREHFDSEKAHNKNLIIVLFQNNYCKYDN